MGSKLQKFAISDLHGSRSWDFIFHDNTLILVGENGTGKTTVLRLLFYFLTGQWTSLLQYEFNRLTLQFDNKTIELSRDLLARAMKHFDPRVTRGLPPSIRQRLSDIVSQGKPFDLEEIEILSDRYGFPVHYLIDEINSGEFSSKREFSELRRIPERIEKLLSLKIIYLPTYRRIEQDINFVLRGMDADDRRRMHQQKARKSNDRYMELVEFGMDDVKSAIKSTLQGLKDYARGNLSTLTQAYLGDVVDLKYEKADTDALETITSKTISSVLDRIHENILSKTQKKKLSQTINRVKTKGGKELSAQEQVLYHYFLRVLTFQEELIKKESALTSFCEVCNGYLVDKTMLFDSTDTEYSFSIHQTVDDKAQSNIQLRHLSSGEKQIVSLFSTLYLSKSERYFVLIDEPELSLSVEWQSRFLPDIIGSGYCGGLVAVTHSPFIYDNALKKYAAGINEFMIGSK